MSNHAPLRILHVLAGLNRGGVETWLMHVLRNIDRDRYQMDFLVHRSGSYDETARSLGARLIPGADPYQPCQFLTRFSDVLRREGTYDVVHSHISFYSGLVMAAAAGASVRVRIAHGHTAVRGETRLTQLRRAPYEASMRAAIRKWATHGIGASNQAAAYLFGPRWEADPRVQLIYCGIGITSFAAIANQPKRVAKAALGIPSERVVLGHVGRFVPLKNHQFLVEVAAELLRRGVDVHLLLVGTGPALPTVQAQVRALGLMERCVFAGGHDNVAPFYRAMDLFMFPSIFEGLPLVTIEAQAAALPMLVSPAVPQEVSVIPGLMRQLPLEAGVAVWVEQAEWLLTSRVPCPTPQEALAVVAASQFGIESSINTLTQIYD